MSKSKNRRRNLAASKSNEIITQTFSYSGPIPPPQALQQYEHIFPGAAERILKMAENQAAHRQALENKLVDSNIGNSRRGQYFGLIIGMTGLIATVIFALLGHTILAGAIGTIDLVSLVAIFVYGSELKKRDQAQKEAKNKQASQSE